MSLVITAMLTGSPPAVGTATFTSAVLPEPTGPADADPHGRGHEQNSLEKLALVGHAGQI